MSTIEEPSRRILWVDDEIEFLRAHIFFLEDHGWIVDKATNGHDALSMALRENYDVVLLDEQMPAGDEAHEHLFDDIVLAADGEPHVGPQSLQRLFRLGDLPALHEVTHGPAS